MSGMFPHGVFQNSGKSKTKKYLKRTEWKLSSHNDNKTLKNRERDREPLPGPRPEADRQLPDIFLGILEVFVCSLFYWNVWLFTRKHPQRNQGFHFSNAVEGGKKSKQGFTLGSPYRQEVQDFCNFVRWNFGISYQLRFILPFSLTSNQLPSMVSTAVVEPYYSVVWEGEKRK